MQNLNPFIALFLSFSLHENSQRGYIRVRKLGCLKTDTHSQRRERRLQENALAWGVESYVTSQRKSSPSLAQSEKFLDLGTLT